MDHSKRLIVFVIVTSAILGYLTLNSLLSPRATPAGPAAPTVAPAGEPPPAGGTPPAGEVSPAGR